jgi:hypothetical protein
MKRPYRVYLAGGPRESDWRYSLVKGLREWDEANDFDAEWPILENAILDQYDYIGPFHLNPRNQPQVKDEWFTINFGVVNALKEADLVYAWRTAVPDPRLVAEISAASVRTAQEWGAGEAVLPTHALIVTQPIAIDPDSLSWFLALDWDACECGGTRCDCAFDTPLEGLIHHLPLRGLKFDSPPEEMFWEEYLTIFQRPYPLIPQYEVFGGRYRLDFANLETKTAVEIDGYEYHGDRQAFRRDRKRDRELMADGWRVLHFAAADVMQDVVECTFQVAHFISEAEQQGQAGA